MILNNNGNIHAAGDGSIVFEVPLTILSGKSLTLAGGQVAAPLITSSNGASISGFGLITGNLVHHGNATFNGPTQVVGTVTNRAGAVITARNSQLLFTGAVVNSGTIRAISGGSVVFDGGLTGNPPAGAPPLGAAAAEAFGSVTASFIRQDSLTLSGNAGDPASYSRVNIRKQVDGGETSVLRTLNIATDGGGNHLGTLDLTDNALIVDYSGSSPMAAIRDAITRARNGGAWDASGLTSSVAALTPNRALGYGEASQVLGLSGTNTASFAGQTADATSVLVRYTLLGDTNLDRQINFPDLLTVAANFGKSDVDWSKGDFNFDGAVTFPDLLSVSAAFGQSLPASIPGASAEFNEALAAAHVPEPGGIALAALGLAFLRRRRR